MIRGTVLKAILAGIGVLVLAQVLYVGVLLKIAHHEFLRLVLLGAPGFAALVAAYLAPNRKLLIGVSMSFHGAVIGLLSAIGYEQFGLPVDHIGGLLATFLILITYYTAWSIAGSLMGTFLSRKFQGQSGTARDL
jgi:hypothetical protein